MATITNRAFDPEWSPKERELAFGAGTYMKRDICLVRGEGIHVFDDKGQKYIDCIAGIAVSILGHAHPDLVKAVSEQMGQIISAPELLCNPVRAEYQRRILEYFPSSFNRVFLCNSGAEANEGAIKFARLSTEKHGIIALKKGFHGKTMGALSSTAEPKYREPFAPLLPNVFHIQPTMEALHELLEEHGDMFSCMMFEPLQGEGGVNVLDGTFVREATDELQKRGVLVIADEVQSGFGRTGKMWGFEHYGIEPDLICVAKAIAGGVPMGGVIVGDRICELPPQSHTSTYGGNPLACRAGLTVLDVIERDALTENAERIGERIRGKLTDANLKLVRDVRGRGLMVGIELKQRAGKYIQLCAEKGLLILLAGPRVIRLLPPLIMTEEQADEVVDILIEVLS